MLSHARQQYLTVTKKCKKVKPLIHKTNHQGKDKKKHTRKERKRERCLRRKISG